MGQNRVSFFDFSAGKPHQQAQPVKSRKDDMAFFLDILQRTGLTIRDSKLIDATQVIRQKKLVNVFAEQFNMTKQIKKQTRFYIAVVERAPRGEQAFESLFDNVANKPTQWGYAHGTYPEFERKPHIIVMASRRVRDGDGVVAPSVAINPKDFSVGRTGKTQLTRDQYNVLVNLADKHISGPIKQLLFAHGQN